MIELVNSAYQPNVKLAKWICGRPRSLFPFLFLYLNGNIPSGYNAFIGRIDIATSLRAFYLIITFHFYNYDSEESYQVDIHIVFSFFFFCDAKKIPDKRHLSPRFR